MNCNENISNLSIKYGEFEFIDRRCMHTCNIIVILNKTKLRAWGWRCFQSIFFLLYRSKRIFWLHLTPSCTLVCENFFFSWMHRNGHFVCLKRGKKITFVGYTRKMRELSIIPVEIAWFSLAAWFFRHFLHHQVSPYNGPKVRSSDWHFSCVPQKEDFLPVFPAKIVAISVHVWEKIKYATREERDDYHSRPSNREFVMTLFISENGLRHQKRGWS